MDLQLDSMIQVTLPVENIAAANTRCMGLQPLQKLRNSKKVGFSALFYDMK
jgi:hypothetical protein